MDAAKAADAPSRASVDLLIKLAKPDMAKVDALIGGQLTSDVPVIPALGEHIISAGGKRLRPLLTVAAARLAGTSGEGFL